jgi:two-component system phosphate regulon sensor histidine kinase PhoR
MSDVPGLPRGSKTAAVVVLVVFLQLLVVAVLGLGAITRDRREGERQALEKAEAEDKEKLGKTLVRVLAEVRRTLGEAAAATDAEALRGLRARDREGLVRGAYVVDARRVVHTVDGHRRLHVPPEAAERMAQEERAESERFQELSEQRRGRLPASTLPPLLALAREFPFSTDRGYPAGVGFAIELVENASTAVGAGDAGAVQALPAALLQALETGAINRGRPELAEWRGLLDKLEAQVDDAVEGAPADQQERLRTIVSEFRAARDGLLAFLPSVREATDRAWGTGPTRLAVEDRPRLVWLPAGELVGVAPRGADRLVVVRLDAEAARRLLEEQVAADGYAPEGLRVVVLRPDETAAGKPVHERDLLRESPPLPFRAVLYRDRPPPMAAAGPAETFYWLLIGLAALGLGIGGWVLSRLLTRETRLARLKADFVSNLSHELKTPLTSISLFTEMLQDGKLGSAEEQQEGFAVLAQESQRLQRIVGRMIEVARREAQGTPYDLRRGDLNAPVLEAATRFRRIVTEPGMDLSVTLAPEPLPIRMDPTAVDDAVTNLLSNGWKYRRGERARIAVRTARRGRRVEVTVDDDGIGIPRRERRRVLQMFYRAEAYLTQPVAGTGLGLALVRTIVRAHRGRVRIETGEGGVGTRVRLSFPRDRRPAAAEPTPPRAPSSPRKIETQVTP